MNSCRRMLLASALVCLVPGSAWADSTGYYDYAQVIDVDPILEEWSAPVSRRICDQGPPPTSAAAIASTIGADIRLQNARWKAARECRQVQERSHRKRIAGYRVTYRYGGQKLVRRLAYDPGERVRVKVGLSPLTR